MTTATLVFEARARARRIPNAGWLLLACLGSRALGFFRPCLSDDEAIYCVVAREMLSGRVLYRDVVDHKPPLIYVVYAATQRLGGAVGGMRLLHLLTAMVVFATASLVGRIAELLGGNRRERLAAGLLYACFSTTLFAFDGLAANCELFMMLPLVASVACVVAASRSSFPLPRLALAGGLVAVAALFKYQAAVQLPLYAGYVAFGSHRRPARVLARWAALVGGAALVIGGAAAVLAHYRALGAAWFWFRFNFAYIREGLHPAEIARRAAVRLSYGVGPALFLWVLGGRAAVRALSVIEQGDPSDDDRPHRRWLAPSGSGAAEGDRFAAAWLVASAFAVTAGGRFFGHYFHQVTAPLAVLAAPAVCRLWTMRRKLVIAAVGVPVAAFFLIGVEQDALWAAAGVAQPDYGTLAGFIDAHSRATDALAVWGNVPVLYFEAGRPLGTRFVFSNYQTGLSPATRSQNDPAFDASVNILPESWEMFEADLAARKPRLFVDTSPGNLAAYGKFPASRYPRLRAILARDYAPLADVDGARVFVRRGPSREP
jgi:hypothetical protein